MNDTRKIRAMVADYELHIRMLVKQVLKSMNAEITAEAGDGSQAVELYRQNKPDLTFLDINMPVKTGVEALKDILVMDPKALVIMLTSVSDMDTVTLCLDAGAANYIRKDTPLEQIKDIIKTTWAEHRKKVLTPEG